MPEFQPFYIYDTGKLFNDPAATTASASSSAADLARTRSAGAAGAVNTES